jgi:hypothetical protein
MKNNQFDNAIKLLRENKTNLSEADYMTIKKDILTKANQFFKETDNIYYLKNKAIIKPRDRMEERNKKVIEINEIDYRLNKFVKHEKFDLANEYLEKVSKKYDIVNYKAMKEEILKMCNNDIQAQHETKNKDIQPEHKTKNKDIQAQSEIEKKIYYNLNKFIKNENFNDANDYLEYKRDYMTPATYEQVRRDILNRKRKHKENINKPVIQSRLISEKINFTTKTDEDHKLFNHNLNTIRNPNNENPDNADNEYKYKYSDLYDRLEIREKRDNNPSNQYINSKEKPDNKYHSTPIFDYININHQPKHFQTYQNF